MPELPEVEVVRRGLAAHVLDREILAVEVLHPRPVRRHLAGPHDFADRLVGHRFTDARRRGKYLWLPLEDTSEDTAGETSQETGGPTDALLAHLGMSGQMLVQAPDAPDERNLRVRFCLDGADAGEGDTELRFVDQRMFGGLAVSPGGADLPPEIAHIARDPLDPAFDDTDFVRRVRRRTAGIKRLLLDQGLISGIGNIYADEALWRAAVHGDRPGDRLTRAQVETVLAAAREVMNLALDQGGTSFDALYVNVNGQSGYFDRSLHAYGQVGRPCARCGTSIVRTQFMNRSSYFCPSCQPPPRRRRRAG